VRDFRLLLSRLHSLRLLEAVDLAFPGIPSLSAAPVMSTLPLGRGMAFPPSGHKASLVSGGRDLCGPMPPSVFAQIAAKWQRRDF